MSIESFVGTAAHEIKTSAGNVIQSILVEPARLTMKVIGNVPLIPG